MRSKHTFLSLLLAAAVFSTQSLQAQVITTFAGDGFGAGTGTGGYSCDGGFAPAARLNGNTGVAFDGAGNVYIADRGNHVIRKVSYTGIITTFAGTGIPGFNGDSILASAGKLDEPYAVATDAAGNVYIADYNNNRIRKVGITGVMRTYAGTGAPGYSGDGGAATAAKLHHPQALTVDQYGNVYVAEAGNHVVRKISPAGGITTVAGNGTFGYSGNGGNGASAQLYGPSGVAVDVYQNLYIADYFNYVVRRVDSNGIITTFAGNHVVGNTGDGGMATSASLHFPSGVSVFGHGDIYIADQGNNNIRRVNAGGIISRVAGTTTNGYSGDGGSPLVAQLSSPKGIAVDGIDRVYIADYDNNVIRLIYDPTAVNNVAGTSNSISVYPNPAKGSFTVLLPENTGVATVTVTDVTGAVVATKTANGNIREVNFDLGKMAAGNYFVKAVCGGKNYSGKIVLTK